MTSAERRKILVIALREPIQDWDFSRSSCCALNVVELLFKDVRNCSDYEKLLGIDTGDPGKDVFGIYNHPYSEFYGKMNKEVTQEDVALAIEAIQ